MSGFADARTGICFKIGAEEGFGDAAKGKDVFCVRCLFMQRILQVLRNGRQSLLSRLSKKGGSVENTRLFRAYPPTHKIAELCFEILQFNPEALGSFSLLPLRGVGTGFVGVLLPLSLIFDLPLYILLFTEKQC